MGELVKLVIYETTTARRNHGILEVKLRATAKDKSLTSNSSPF